MKKIIAAITLMATLTTTAVGCTSWWQNFQNDPVQQVQSFEQGIQVVLSDAQIAWAVILPFLPAANVAAITKQYQDAVFAVNHALSVLNDAVTAAIAAQQPNPDFSKLMGAVTDAVSQVLAIIQQYTSATPAPGPAPAVAAAPAAASIPALVDAQAGLASLKKQYVH